MAFSIGEINNESSSDAPKEMPTPNATEANRILSHVTSAQSCRVWLSGPDSESHPKIRLHVLCLGRGVYLSRCQLKRLALSSLPVFAGNHPDLMREVDILDHHADTDCMLNFCGSPRDSFSR